MIRDITLGQYFPGETIVHRLDARTKLLVTLLYIICVFTATNALSYTVVVLFLVTVTALTRIRPRVLFRGLKPLVLIIAVTAILNMFYTPGEPLVQWWIFSISAEGIKVAVFMLLRIMLLVMGTFLLTYTTSPIALTDGIEMLLGGLKKFKVPIHELSMVMSIALRFIPSLLEETDKIMNAQKARGADFETGKITDRAKALLPLLVPLFVSAFRRADELAVAMECRCYNGGEGRTRMKQLRYRGADYIALSITVLVLCGVIAISILGAQMDII